MSKLGRLFENSLMEKVIRISDHPDFSLRFSHNASHLVLPFKSLQSSFSWTIACSLTGSITNLVVIPQLSLSVSENNRLCQRSRVSQLDKAPQLNIAPQGTVTSLPTYCSQEDHDIIPSFQTSRLMNRHILDLEQGRTPEAIQMKVEACVENRQLTVRMTKNMMSINKILQSRLLDLMQLRLCNASKVAFSSRRVKTNGPEETKQLPK